MTVRNEVEADKTGKIIGHCSGNVFTNGIKAARANVDETVCSNHDSTPPPIAPGSPTVFINGLQAATVSDKIACGAFITDGSSNVFIVAVVPRMMRPWRKVMLHPR